MSLILVLVAYKVVESIADAIYGVLQTHGGLRYVGRSLLYKSVIGIVLFILTDIITKSILLSSAAILLVNAILVTIYDARIALRHQVLRVPLTKLRGIVAQAGTILARTWPILAITFLATFSINIPRFFIDKYDSAQIGYFGIIAVPITLIAVFMSFILQPNIVSLASMYQKSKYVPFNRLIKRIIGITFGFGLVVAVAAFVIGVPILNFVFGLNFSNHKPELMIMILGGIANAVVAVFISIFTIIRKFKAQFYTLLLTNVVLVGLSYVYVQRFGMLGGVTLYAVASVVQMVVVTIIYFVSARNEMRSQAS